MVVYVKDNISFIRRHDLENEDIEFIWLHINRVNCKPYRFDYFYLSPAQ